MGSALQLASGPISAIGGIASGQNQAGMLNSQADIATTNSNLALQAGVANARKQQMMSSQKIGAERAGISASGVDSGSGSALAVLQSSSMNAELDRLNILHGSQVQSTNFVNQATMDRDEASQSISASYMNAASSLLFASGSAMKGPSGGKQFSFGDNGPDDGGDGSDDNGEEGEEESDDAEDAL